MPSPAATNAALNDDERAIYEAGAIIASLGFFGMIWLDRDLIVRNTYGWIVDFVAIGCSVTDSVLAFIGLESEIKALRDHPDRQIELPVVGMATGAASTEKLNFTCFWNSADDCPMALAYRSTSQNDLELELSRQIRARLIAEAAVIETSQELARANADLEAFASIVSHDLKAPLRHMRQLAKSALDDPSVAGAASVAETLNGIAHQAERLSRMLTVLFDYSALGRKSEAIEHVETAEVLDTICAGLPKSGYSVVKSGEWPALETMRAPLDLVIRNLIANAINHHDRPIGTIEVSGRTYANVFEITVADDGPGIDTHHHETIFLPFRTLSSNINSGSTGMGLAMVKRALESVGGSIQVAVTERGSRGTTFTVLWPKDI